MGTQTTQVERDEQREKVVARNFADIVVGGQAGSEGKGAIAAHLIRTEDYSAAVRPGSTNAGHTVYRPDGSEYVHQALPSAASVDPSVACYMAPESSFSLGELFEEHQDVLDYHGSYSLGIDPKAAVITDAHRHTEADRRLGDDIGSTVHGCGAVRVEKIWRSSGDVRLAEGYDALEHLVTDGRVPERLLDHAADGPVMIEGTQGTLLSMNQSEHWPFTTSRDCVASSFLSSVGLAPSAERTTWAVFRTYPIRVGGNSGPLDGEEIDFATIAERAGHDEEPVEFTSVTNKKRRIFEWSEKQFEAAIRLNDPDLLAITFLDYLDADNYGVSTWWGLTDETKEWVRRRDANARAANGSRVAVLKTGPKPEHTIDLREELDLGGDSRDLAMRRLPEPQEEPEDHRGWFDDHPRPGYNGGVEQ